MIFIQTLSFDLGKKIRCYLGSVSVSLHLLNIFLFFYRLASVQEHRAPQIPTNLVGGKIPSAEDKRALLENIKAMVPDHQTRLRKLEVWISLYQVFSASIHFLLCSREYQSREKCICVNLTQSLANQVHVD